MSESAHGSIQNLRVALDRIHERIARAAERAGRNRDEVTLVAVSKTFPVDLLQAAIRAGVKDLGENRAQELREKARALGNAARWHFVGPLQTNKVRLVVGTAQLIHSVDRIELAEVISKRASAVGTKQHVLIEINTSGESNKHGAQPADAMRLAERANALDKVVVDGLMTMAPFSEEPETSRPFFKQLAHLQDEVASVVPSAVHLSMGMSRDFEIAIEEGATIVRVGEAIFGSRAH